MQFVVVAEHSPQLCPTSNGMTRNLLRKGADELPALASKLGVNLLTIRVYGPDHIILAVADAADIEQVREFVFQSQLAQWNTVKINATWSMEEALEKAEALPAIF